MTTNSAEMRPALGSFPRRARRTNVSAWLGVVLAVSALSIQPLTGQEYPSLVLERTVAMRPAHLEARLTAAPNTVAPGGLVRLTYAVWSTEEADTRVRVRVDAGPDWRVADEELPPEEIVRGWNYIEGDVYLHAPDEATIGERRVVRLLVDVLGTPGLLETEETVTVAKRSARTQGGSAIATVATLGISHLGAASDQRRPLSALQMSSKVRKSGTFSLSYEHAALNALSNFRYEEPNTRLVANLRHAGWDLSVGNYVAASGNAIVGPYVRGRGVNVRRLTGPWVTDVVVSQPSSVGSMAAGHLVRGRAGIRTQSAILAVSASDFRRPWGGYNPNSTLQTTVLNLDSEDQLAFERRITETSAENRAQGIGADIEVTPGRGQRMALKVGTLWLSNTSAARSQGATGEASYSLSRKAGSVNLRWRDMPATVPGVSLLGDERGADGSLRVAGSLHVVGSAYQSSTTTAGNDLGWRSENVGYGLRVARGVRRFEVRSNYRDSRYGVSTIRRTFSVITASPLGPFTLSANADLGTQQMPTRRDRVSFGRLDMRWNQHGNSVTLTATHSGVGPVNRQRLDLLSSLKWRDTEFAGGAWATRGYAAGGKPGLWATVGLPLVYDSSVIVGLDYSPLTWTDRPSLRGMVSLRKRMMFTNPFFRQQASLDSLRASGEEPLK